MELINLLEIKTPFGYKQFKLVQGDISKIDFPVDLLCTSAFKNGYEPLKGTLLGSLYENRGIDLAALAESPSLDLRTTQDTFLTQVITDFCIKRILCVEMIGTDKSIEQIIDSLLISLFTAELKEIKIKSIMIPLLGTGHQKIDPTAILGTLLKKVEYLLKTSANVEEVYLVAFKEQEAQQLNDAMNILLKRSVSVFHKNQIISTVSSNIRQTVREHPVLFHAGCFSELLELLQEDDINSFNLAITSRKICEYILNDILADGMQTELARKINQLRNLHIAPWMINYFHMLRIFGNAYAHDQADNANKQMNEQDILIALFGLERVLEFYLDFK
jgi:hypothetical protein